MSQMCLVELLGETLAETVVWSYLRMRSVTTTRVTSLVSDLFWYFRSIRWVLKRPGAWCAEVKLSRLQVSEEH